MLYALICKDKPGHLQVRIDTRDRHLAYLGGLNDAGTLKLAGPFLDDAGKSCGSLVIIEAADEGEARRHADGDPYAKAGLFESVEIRPWSWVFNKPAAA